MNDSTITDPRITNTDAISEVFDLDKKTIIHIPNVNSGESTKDKIEEVGFIIDSIGQVHIN